MSTQRCVVCDKRVAPVEGITGQCHYCGELFCLGHLSIKSHDCKPRFHLDEYEQVSKEE